MAKRDIWFQLDSRIFNKFEVIHIAKTLGITINETIGALVRLWSISITDFPDGKGSLISGSLKVTKDHLPSIMALDFDGDQIYQALNDCSWIDEVDGTVVLPDWEKKIGQTILKLDRDKKRKQTGGNL